MQERVQVAADLAKENLWRPSLFRLALSRNCIPKHAVHMRDKDGRTLLHVVGWVIGQLATDSLSKKYEVQLEGMLRNSTIVMKKYL